MQEFPAPVVPPSKSLPEITPKAVILGIVLSAIMAGANAYLGLKVGMTVSASIPAAVISMAVLRLFRTSNILENNIVQTAASAGEALAAGVIFTLPALIILGYWKKFEFLPTLAIALCGGILGVLFTIPLRRALIIEAKLRFPEGLATGEVLKAGAEGGQGARAIAVSGIAGALLKLAQTGLRAVSGKISGSVTAGGATVGFGSELGVALLAVGYIVGLNIGILVVIGGAISWFVGIPIYMKFGDPHTLAAIIGDSQGYAAAEAVWSERIRYMGVGAMATGGLWALVELMKPIRDGIRSSMKALRKARSGEAEDALRTERDISIKMVATGTLVLAIPIFIVFWFVIDRQALGISPGMHVATVAFGGMFSLVAGFLFSSVAGYMAGLVGSSNSPISGVTIATILAVSLLLLLILGSQIDFTIHKDKALVAAATAIMVGAVVCCAASIAGDNLQDLKAGQIVGATPAKQELMLIVGVVTAAVCITPVLQLLFSAYGLGDVLPREGMDPKETLSAPQAVLMALVALGTMLGNLPWTMIYIGVGIAVVIIALDKRLEARGSEFRMPVLAVAIGIYLPFELSVPIFVGGFVSHFAARALGGASADTRAQANRRGLLFASGLITGEALMGIVLAIPFAAFQSTDVLALPLGKSFAPVADVLGVVAFAAFTAWLYSVAKRTS